jgi:Zn-dependent M32 family carboxypeptidase
MKNKYLFDQNKEELLKNTELNVSEAKKIPADQLSDYSNAVSECDEIMEERKKDESNYMERMKEFLQKLFATKDNDDLHPEIKKMYRKLYHAVAYQEDGIIKMNDSAEVIKQIYSDLATIFGYTETEAEALKERLA